MSQLTKYIQAKENTRYLFKIALDHAPEQGEVDDIEARIQGGMMALGVPTEQVGVFVYKSTITAGTDLPQDEQPRILGDDDERYLLCILVRSGEGGYTEDPDIVVSRATRAFVKYAELPAENVAAVVLEDAYLEVDKREKSEAMVGSYAQRNYGKGPRRR